MYTSNERWVFFITGTITSGKLKKDIVKGSMCGGEIGSIAVDMKKKIRFSLISQRSGREGFS